MRISIGLDFEIEDGDPFLGRLAYSDTDPYAVTVTLPGDVVWLFARELFDGPPHQTVGDGDVQICNCGPHVYLRFASPEGEAIVRTARTYVDLFLKSTYNLVPRGTEETLLDFDPSMFLDGAA
jgi:hypothetical protein